MTIGQLKKEIMALAKRPLSTSPFTLQDKMTAEHIHGYNQAIADVMVVIQNVKKEEHGQKGTVGQTE